MGVQNAIYMDQEELDLFLLWGQTEEDRQAIADHFAEEAAVSAHREVAKRISETSTVSGRRSSSAEAAADFEITEEPNTVRVLFPSWGFVEASLQHSFEALEAA